MGRMSLNHPSQDMSVESHKTLLSGDEKSFSLERAFLKEESPMLFRFVVTRLSGTPGGWRRHKPVNQSRGRCTQVVPEKCVDAEIGANFAGNARSEFEKYDRKRSEWLRPTG